MAKQIMTMKPKQRVLLNEVENKMRNARNGNDYFRIEFGRKGEFIQISFNKDQTYTVGYNIWNMEFSVKLNIMIKQYAHTNPNKISAFVFDWVNRLNR